MTKLLITGGQERENGFDLGEGKYYKAAKMLRLDTETGKTEELFVIDEGNENYPDEHPNLEFTAGSVEGNKLWLATDTEVLQLSYPELEILERISYPFFHNIHHVCPFNDYIAVVSTGIDLLVLLSRETYEPIKLLNTDGKEVWHRFSEDIDYRKIHSTRPHDCHPNFVFMLDNALWVTRCTQEDAVCMNDFSKRIDISREKAISVHDGHYVNGLIYFTSVDGFIIIADPKTYKVIEDINLLDFEENNKVAKGWCRGIHIANDIIYVAFSRLRKTRNRKKLNWLYKMSSSNNMQFQSSIAAYDLKKKTKLNEWVLPEGSIDAIYSVLPEPV